ncbi:hypothetical protein QVD17_15870 [Tagetes erecta]|uniref:LOB domain-containing protein n=1 Tax=Tagetes erecta TaxID=13708 RepID=A0AAD8P009_TARER|nr:hypothetical protein QVD17_15870 [Tagetes erecta]
MWGCPQAPRVDGELGSDEARQQAVAHSGLLPRAVISHQQNQFQPPGTSASQDQQQPPPHMQYFNIPPVKRSDLILRRTWGSYEMGTEDLKSFMLVNHHPPCVPGQIMTLKGGTSQACAACKYQRKRCTPECALAPHFRPEQTEIFKNAHKLFGVRNILRILEQVDPAQKNEAMRSIIYQANMRERSPVHGCLGVIYQLQYQIKQSEKEFYAVCNQLQAYKQQLERQQEITMDTRSPDSQHLQLGMSVDQVHVHPGLNLFQNENNDHHHHPVSGFQICYSGNENGSGDHGYHNNNNSSHVINNHVESLSKDNINMNMQNNVMWGTQHQTYYPADQNINADKCHEMVNNSFQEEVTHDYDEIYPFFDTIDDTQSYIDSKEANESSSESSLKESAGNKLKNAQLQLGIVSEDYQTFA